MSQKIKIIGVSDEVGTCDCCGRTDLKKTVMLLVGSGESLAYFGTECAAKAIGSTAKFVSATVRKVEDERRTAERLERTQKANEEDRKLSEFLAVRSSKPSRALQIEELGGFAKVREMFTVVK